MSLVRLCIMNPIFRHITIQLNHHVPVQHNSNIIKGCLKNLTDSQFQKVEEHGLVLCVEGAGYALNAKSPTATAKRLEFVHTAFYVHENDFVDLL